MSNQVGQLIFLNPAWLLIGLLFLICGVFFRLRRRSGEWSKVIAPPVLDYLGGRQGIENRWNTALIAAAITAIALSEPVIRQSNDETWRQSTGWIIVADISRSMTLTDVVPSRLSAARLALNNISAAAGARPIALILYAGDAFLVAPPAFDYTVFNEHAALLEHGLIPVEGSNLARALSLASSVIEGSHFVNARVLLLTDSGGISKSSMAAAQFLADAGHQLDVLLIGTEQSEETETSIDLKSALLLAESGNGRLVQTDGFGNVDIHRLELSDQAAPSTHHALKSLVWKLQSHWILLLVLPLILVQFKDEAQV